MFQIKRQVFYSFHYAIDAWRAGQVRNMGIVEGNKLASDNDWEEVRRKGKLSIQNWINAQMEYRSCVVVLIGSKTASREWVLYEIIQGWNKGKGVVGIYIHNLKDRDGRTDVQGKNPFDLIELGKNGKKLSDVVRCYNPKTHDAYNDIKSNLSQLIEEAIEIRNRYR